jgi:hypothetical protein
VGAPAPALKPVRFGAMSGTTTIAAVRSTIVLACRIAIAT